MLLRSPTLRLHAWQWLVSVLLLSLSCGVCSAEERSTPVVAVPLDQPGAAIPAQALGLSFETSILLPNPEGVRYFRPDNAPLLQLFQTIGVTSLRIGGNSVDDAKVPQPSLVDVASLFEFARLAKVQVIYSVRLKDGKPADAAKYARLIWENYQQELASFSIGNEPGYYKDYDLYCEKWIAIRDAILQVYPTATFCGPDVNPHPERIKQLAERFGTPEGRLSEIAQHSYPFGCSYENPSVAWRDPNAVDQLRRRDAAAAQAAMLNDPPYALYEEILQGMQAAVEGTSLTFRLTETNSYWFSGLEGASDRYAAALWGLDYLHWWVSRGAAGINFHTGDRTGGSVNLPCRYAAFVTSEQGYQARPLAYGMKLFALAATGRQLPVEISSDAPKTLTAYATSGEQGSRVTLINRAFGETATDLQVRVQLGQAVAGMQPQIIFLRSQGNDPGATSAGVTLGGAAIQEDGRWAGQWKSIPQADLQGDSVLVSLPPASAAVLSMRPQ